MDRNISDLRTEYKKNRLDENSLLDNPLKQLERWLDEAIKAEVNEPTAMALATSTKEGRPSARMVLLKGVDDSGLMFYTNYNSRKGRELAENPYASVILFWAELERQVRVEGIVNKVSEEESDNYFRSRPLTSRIGAAVSPQSQVIPDRSYLEKMVAKFEASLDGDEVTRPANWGGYRLLPDRIEFWQGRESRLHDRILYQKENSNWHTSRLAP